MGATDRGLTSPWMASLGMVNGEAERAGNSMLGLGWGEMAVVR